MKPWGADRPDDETLRRLVMEEGLTDREIGVLYGVTAESVRYWRGTAKPAIEKHRPKRMNHRADGAIPWVLNTRLGHHNDPIARTLRVRNAMSYGKNVPSDAAERVRRLERDLASINKVLTYDWDNGFGTITRDAQIDAPGSIVRMPVDALS